MACHAVRHVARLPSDCPELPCWLSPPKPPSSLQMAGFRFSRAVSGLSWNRVATSLALMPAPTFALAGGRQSLRRNLLGRPEGSAARPFWPFWQAMPQPASPVMGLDLLPSEASLSMPSRGTNPAALQTRARGRRQSRGGRGRRRLLPAPLRWAHCLWRCPWHRAMRRL
jgi:hypothetical protein